jgi:RHS repeat-associated protein
VDGLQTWNVTFNNGMSVTNQTITSYDPTHGYRIVTAVAPDGSTAISTNLFGRPISVTSKDATGVQIGQMTYGYDTQGRQSTVTDARNGTTTSYFNNADQVSGTLTPSPDGVQGGQITTNYFDSMGRVIKATLPDNTSVTNTYYSTGLREETYGSRTYPVLYSYDAQGRMTTMTTWTNFAASAGAAVTAWNYDGYRGFLTNKAYADGKGPSYTYTAAGRLQTRVWARGITTTYTYDNAGGLSTVGYSDSTAGMGYGYDRQGRTMTITNGATVCTLAYNDAGKLLGESYTGGPLDGLSVTNGYDTLLRRIVLSLNSPSSTLNTNAYGYDAASRLSTVASGTNSAIYAYVANSPLVSQIVFTNGNALCMTTTKTYDYLNRLTQIQSSAGGSTVGSFNYANNAANQRTAVTNADNSYWIYQYDSLGQVISGKKYWTDGTPVAGQQFTYNFDDIGNRKTTASGGDSSGANLRSVNYAVNNLNQYTGRNVPGYVDILGEANSNATVTVDLQRAYRYGNYFQDELSFDNTSAALYPSLTNLAVLNNGTNVDIITTNIGNVLLPQTPETFGYDSDGNMTNSGRWTVAWDGENRAISFASLASAPSASKKKVDCAYDYKGRRIQKIVSTWNGSAYVAQSTNRFIYDGWNLVGVLDGNDSLLYSFQWGTDLSGTMQGAGGVGGLISMAVYSGTNAGTYFYSFDGNGNVAALVNATNGAIAAQYEYGPFGEPIRATGPLAFINPFLFSTKYYDSETALYYYGYRYYDSSIGRWPNRDPIEERGGKNLYGFVGNHSLNDVDMLGCLVGTVSFPQYYGYMDTSTFWAERGFKVEITWTPPASWGDKPCCHCMAAGWTQYYNDGTIDIPPNDEDSTGMWFCDAPTKAAILADQPHVGDIAYWMLQSHSWSFKDTLTCMEGKDVGKVYATVYWGGTYTYDSMPVTSPYIIQ